MPVNVGNGLSAIVPLDVVERLGKDVIFGCDFCVAHLEAIGTRFRIANLTDGPTVSIIDGCPKRLLNAAPVPSDEKCILSRAARQAKLVFPRW